MTVVRSWCVLVFRIPGGGVFIGTVLTNQVGDILGGGKLMFCSTPCHHDKQELVLYGIPYQEQPARLCQTQTISLLRGYAICCAQAALRGLGGSGALGQRIRTGHTRLL